MVEKQQITKAEMLLLYNEDQISEIVNTNDKLFAKTTAHLHNLGYKPIVWCNL